MAERSGIMPRLLAGHVDRRVYCGLLRNLHALYETLECALERHAGSPLVAPVRFPALFRAAALTADLRHLCGAGWEAKPLAGAMDAYVARIEAIALERPELLAAHAYVRYMGDLNGGQILRGVVTDALALKGDLGTAFYSFGALDPAAAGMRFREALDALPVDEEGAAAIVAEANDAFARHMRLFEELDRLPRPGI
jgi:heme oxygenase